MVRTGPADFLDGRGVRLLRLLLAPPPMLAARLRGVVVEVRLLGVVGATSFTGSGPASSTPPDFAGETKGCIGVTVSVTGATALSACFSPVFWSCDVCVHGELFGDAFASGDLTNTP